MLPGDELDGCDESQLADASDNSTSAADDTECCNEPSSASDCISEALLRAFHSDPSAAAPDVRPCNTPNGSDIDAELTQDIIYKHMGCRRFKGKRVYQTFAKVWENASFTDGGKPIQSIGEFSTLNKRKRGQMLPPSKKYLDKVCMDIVYDDVISKLGFCYALVLIDRATKYIWVYGLKSLTSPWIIDALEQFQADASGLPKQLCCDCDQKLLGGNTGR